MKILKSKIFQHFLYWVLFLLYGTLLYGQYSQDYGKQFISFLSYLPQIAFAVYITNYLLIPRYLLKGRYALFGFYLILTLGAAGVMQWAVVYYYLLPELFPDSSSSYTSFFSIGILLRIPFILFYVFIAAAGRLFFLWQKNQKAKQELTKEKVEAELKFLKAQIHPHFLFNTLNNIFVLTKKKSDEAPELILKLSALLRYILYECSEAAVSLEKEINVIRNYLDIERIRFGDNLHIAFDAEGDISHHRIPPALLLPLVENAFKHGVSQATENREVAIKLIVNADHLKLNVRNTYSVDSADSSSGFKEGIGLKNVKRRLELVFGEMYDLDISKDKDYFHVDLEIKWNEHED